MTWTHLDTFSGIGGFALAAAWTGRIETVGFVEIDPWCRRVLAKHWPGVPIHDDIRTFLADAESGGTGGQGEGNQDARLGLASGGTGFVRRQPDLLTGGFPCQPFSAAGKQQSERDDRYLWPELARVIRCARPRWCLLENVPGIIGLVGGLDRVLADLDSLGYATGTVVIPAAAVGAYHRRDRVWIVAHDNSLSSDGRPEPGHGWASGHSSRGSDVAGHVAHAAVQPERGPDLCPHADTGCGQARQVPPSGGLAAGDVPVAHAQRCDGRTHDEGQSAPERDGYSSASRRAGHEALGCLGDAPDGLSRRLAGRSAFGPDWELGIPRVTAHEADRVNKLKALGNAIVPHVAYELLLMMLAVDDEHAGAAES